MLYCSSVVFKTMATCARVSDGEFTKRLNELISKNELEVSEVGLLFNVNIPKELEMLAAQQLGVRKGKENIVIWLWCKSPRSSRQFCELKKSDKLLKRLDALITWILSESTHNLLQLLASLRHDTRVPQFLKTLSLDTMQFDREVGKYTI